MLRSTVNLPYHGFFRTSYCGRSKIHLSSRRFQPGREPSRGGGAGRGLILTIGAITLSTGGAVVYAKYDPSFRKWLESNVPYSQEFIKTVSFEESHIADDLESKFTKIKSQISDTIFGTSAPTVKKGAIKSESDKTEAIKKEIPVSKKEPIRSTDSVSTDKKSVKTTTTPVVQEKPKPNEIGHEKIEKSILDAKDQSVKKIEKDVRANLLELEAKAAVIAVTAVEAYKKAAASLNKHSNEMNKLIEESFDKLDSYAWIELKKKADERDNMFKEAEEVATTAFQNLESLKHSLEDPLFSAEENIASVKLGISRAFNDVEIAKSLLEKELKAATVTEKYWKKVEGAREHFEEELKILFPSIRVSDKKLQLSQDDIDLFVLHACQNILYYQKELHKLETLGEERIRNALKMSGDDPASHLMDTKVHLQLEHEKRLLENEFQKKILALKAQTERDMRLQLKRQSEAHSDHLQDVVMLKQQEMERHYQRLIDEKVTDEAAHFKQQLAAMLGRLKGLETALKARADADKHAQQSQKLWGACQALYRSLKAGSPGVPWTSQLRPLEAEISAVKNAAEDGDELITTIVEGIPKEAITRGVYPEDALRQRFLKVERVARKLALVPEGGASLPVLLLSYIQSLLLLPSIQPISKSELEDQPQEFDKLDTYDILQRARFWLDRGDFNQTLRYMNLLRGASRAIARDWMNETRILLETQQAANTLMAHAAANALLYV